MTESLNKADTGDYQLCLRLLRESRPYHRALCVFSLVSLLATPVALLTPFPLKIAVDSGLGDQPLPDFLTWLLPVSVTESQSLILVLSALMVVLVMLLTHLQWVGSTLLHTTISERMVLDFRAKLFRQVQRLSFSFHDERGSADSTYRIQWDAASIQYVTIDGIIPLISSLITLLAMVYVTFALDWQLGLVALAVSPALIFLTQYFRPRLRSRAKQVKQLESSAFSVIPETLGALRVVRAFGQEEREQVRFVDHSRASLGAKIRYAIAECGMGMAVGLTTAVGTAVVLYVGARHVQHGHLSLGELLLVMSYLTQLYGPLKSLSNKIATMQTHLASAERAFALLDEKPDVSEKPDAIPIERANGHFRLDNVSFRYSPTREILSHVNLDILPGTRVGIAGKTGAGKTTFVSLLMRFYDVTDGAIYLDGIDIRDLRLHDLRKQISIVLQDPTLFSNTIADNIAYSRPEATKEQIVAAAQAANAHEFILGLPDGYDTVVGERGMSLSGGERQRVSLARAFLRDAPILILDEPTSSVDNKTESSIMEAMERLMKGRTTFIIAHRLNTLNQCDLGVVLDDGKVVPHDSVQALVSTLA